MFIESGLFLFLEHIDYRLLCPDWMILYSVLKKGSNYRQVICISPNTLIGNSKFVFLDPENLADSRFVTPIHLLTLPPIGGTFFRIQDGSRPTNLDILCKFVNVRFVGLWQVCIRGYLGNWEVVAYDFVCEVLFASAVSEEIRKSTLRLRQKKIILNPLLKAHIGTQ
jgi:hypothetical protein